MTKEQLTFAGMPVDGSIPEKLYMVVFDNDRKLIVDQNFREEDPDFKFDMTNELVIYSSLEGQRRVKVTHYMPFECIQSIHFRS